MKRKALAGATLAAALILAACSSDSDSDSGSSSASSTAGELSTTAESTADSSATAPSESAESSQVASASSGASSAEASDTSSPGTPDGLELVDSLPAGATPVDEITWGLAEGEPISLDTKIQSSYVFPNLCDSLLRLNPDYSVSPAIAESADWVDPVTFVIKLRPDVKFWDGTPVTADDVAYSLSRHQDPTSQWYAAFVMVSSIEATDASTVTVHFNMPWSSFRDAARGRRRRRDAEGVRRSGRGRSRHPYRRSDVRRPVHTRQLDARYHARSNARSHAAVRESNSGDES